MDFYSLDVETANEDYSSICQIGIAEFKDGRLHDTWSTFINPECEFSPMNVMIHGIGEADVVDAPTYDEIYPEISRLLYNQITVHHSPFDRVAMNYASDNSGFDEINTKWLDSARIVRRTWDQFSRRGYGLSNVARFFDIQFNHHDALEDAVAAGKIALKACEESGISIDEWLYAVDSPITTPADEKRKELKPNTNGPLYGETAVFTGSLISMSRSEAYEVASEAGCVIKSTISKKVSVLVVGIQDLDKLNGYKKSSKHRKALKYIEKGHDISIITERDFLKMLETKG